MANATPDLHETMKHVDPMGGYLRGMHINWGVPLRGVTVWGVISGG